MSSRFRIVLIISFFNLYSFAAEDILFRTNEPISTMVVDSIIVTSKDSLFSSTYAEAKKLEEQKEFYKAVTLLSQLPLDSSNKKSALHSVILLKIAMYLDSAGNYSDAAEIYYSTYLTYPLERISPLALYSAGRLYEKMGKYEKAISIYHIMHKFSPNILAENAAYSIGGCYQKLNKPDLMAKALEDAAKEYFGNRNNQLYALLVAAKYHSHMGDMKKAEYNFNMTISIYEAFHSKMTLSSHLAAEAYYYIGEIKRQKMNGIRLKTKTEKVQKANLTLKQNMIKSIVQNYTESIACDSEDWTYKATLGLAISYSDYAEALYQRSYFTRGDTLLASQINTLKQVQQYYDKQQEKLLWILQTCKERNVTPKEKVTAEEYYCRAAFIKGLNFEELAGLYESAPIPEELSHMEQRLYSEELLRVAKGFQKDAKQTYEENLAIIHDWGMRSNNWCDSITLYLTQLNIQN